MTEKEKLKDEFNKRIYRYVLRLVKFLNTLAKSLVLREIISQLLRSGTSIGANYFETKGAASKKDYQNFFAYSLKSANETEFWLSILIDGSMVPADLVSEGEWLRKETRELANIFASSILTMKKRKETI